MGEFKPTTILLFFYLFHFFLSPFFTHLFLDYFLDFISTIGLLVIALYQRKKKKKFEWFLLGFPIYIVSLSQSTFKVLHH